MLFESSSLVSEANSMGIVLEEEDQVKMKYLTASMTASRSTYAA